MIFYPCINVDKYRFVSDSHVCRNVKEVYQNIKIIQINNSVKTRPSQL